MHWWANISTPSWVQEWNFRHWVRLTSFRIYAYSFSFAFSFHFVFEFISLWRYFLRITIAITCFLTGGEQYVAHIIFLREVLRSFRDFIHQDHNSNIMFVLERLYYALQMLLVPLVKFCEIIQTHCNTYHT